MSNFAFLKKKNESFFKIISEAEKLFRDEYFEQAVVQTRRFAENLCRDMLEDKISDEDTFDSMINKIKDNSYGNTRMKELVDDLFFIKKHGNISAHSVNSDITPEIALECLERAYEVSVFYYHIKYGADKTLDKSLFSEELLMTGKKPPKSNLKEKYVKEIKKQREVVKKVKPKKVKKASSNQKIVSPNKKRNYPQKQTQGIKSCLFSFVMLIFLVSLLVYLKLN